MTKTTQRFLVMLLTNPKVWFFMQLLIRRYYPPKQEPGEYRYTRSPAHKKAIWPDEILEGLDTRVYQQRMMPFFRRAVAAYYAGYIEEAMEICKRILPNRPFEIRREAAYGITRSGDPGRLLFVEDTAWQSFLSFFFPENSRVMSTFDGTRRIIFEADRTVTLDQFVDDEGIRALYEEMRNTSEIETIEAKECFDGYTKVSVTRRNRNPPMYDDFSFKTSDPLHMTFKSKRKRQRKRLWLRSKIV